MELENPVRKDESKNGANSVNKITWTLALQIYLVGSLVVLPWNLLMDSLPSVRDILQYNSLLGRSNISTVALTTSFNFAMFFGLLLFTYFRWHQTRILYLSYVILIGFVVVFVTEAISLKIYVNIIMCATLVFIGLTGSFITNRVISLSAQLEPYAAGASDAAQGGVGFSGILTAVLWLFLTQIVFSSLDNHTKVLYSMIFSTIVFGLLTLGAMYATRCIMTTSSAKKMLTYSEAIKNQSPELFSKASFGICAESTQLEDANALSPVKNEITLLDSDFSLVDKITLMEAQHSGSGSILIKQASFMYGSFSVPVEVTAEKRHDILAGKDSFYWGELLKTIYLPILHLFVTCFITCTLFPNLTPLNWNDLTTSQMDIGMGMYQIGTFVGRGIPIIYHKIHEFPRWIFLLFIWIRWGMFPIFYYINLHVFLKFFFIFFLAFSNGILCSTESFYAVRISESLGVAAQCKAAGSSIASVSAGVSVGSLAAIYLCR